MRGQVVACLCLAGSLVVHGGGVAGLVTPQNRLVAAGPPPALVQAGNSFADMVNGQVPDAPPAHIEDTPPTEDLTPQAEVTPTPQVAPDDTRPAEVDQTAQPTNTLQLEAEEITDQFADVQASVIAPVEGATAQPVSPEVATATPVAPRPVEPLSPAIAPQTLESVAPDVLEALPDVQVNEVTARTVRPPTRPSNLGETPPPPRQTAQQPRPTQQQARPTQGNAQQDTNRGTQTNQPNGQATQQGQGQQVDQAAVQAARQAAAAYPNAVMRRISRTRRENTRLRGVAVVAFRVGSGGQLISVGIARSSGSDELDRIAVDHVRRAAPFPPPPPGAQTSFNVQIQGS